MIARMKLLKPFNKLNRFFFLKKDWKKGIKIFLITFIGFCFFNDHVQILRNTSESMPYKIFLYFPKITPKKGDITVTFFDGKYLIKQIIGEQDDDVYYDFLENIHVGHFNVGPLQKEDSHKKKIEGIDEQTIKENFVFLYAPHVRSFDSRYKNFGLVHKNKLQGKAIPLF